MSNVPKNDSAAVPASNFIRNIIDADLAAGKHAQRRWRGQPGTAMNMPTNAVNTIRATTLGFVKSQ